MTPSRLSALVALAFASCGLVTAVSHADAPLTKEEAAARVRSEGYPLVTKLEQMRDTWNVWASRNGIAYEVQIDARDGSLIGATPAEAND